MTGRDICVRLHRYVGLATAVFLIVTGLTGSVLAFQHEIDAWLNPGLFEARDGGPPLPPLELLTRVEAAEPRLRVVGLPLKVEPGWSARLSVQPRPGPATGRPFSLGYDQVFAAPATGEFLGTRRQRDALIPIIYRLHFTLLDPSGIGRQVLGWVAVAWTLDCFVGFYLTLPRRGPVLAKWATAWRVKRGASFFRLNLDLHRASGLWLWGMLFAVALSSVYFNLHQELFRPAVELFSPVAPSPFDERDPDPTRAAGPRLSFADALRLAEDEAGRRRWTAAPGFIFHHLSYGFYAVRFWPSQYDRGSGLGPPVLYVDDRDGSLLAASVPGEGSAGDIVMQLQYPLHSGRLAGLPGRIVVCLSGVVVVLLTVTGVVIWWKKRAGRRARKARAPARGLAAAADSEP